MCQETPRVRDADEAMEPSKEDVHEMQCEAVQAMKAMKAMKGGRPPMKAMKSMKTTKAMKTEPAVKAMKAVAKKPAMRKPAKDGNKKKDDAKMAVGIAVCVKKIDRKTDDDTGKDDDKKKDDDTGKDDDKKKDDVQGKDDSSSGDNTDTSSSHWNRQEPAAGSIPEEEEPAGESAGESIPEEDEMPQMGDYTFVCPDDFGMD
ncbi:unnamed protein product [Symbiodinium sp. KB8]|nr:unnamed protein product [Symbiodinium sp. KB8]